MTDSFFYIKTNQRIPIPSQLIHVYSPQKPQQYFFYLEFGIFGKEVLEIYFNVLFIGPTSRQF